MSDGQLPAKGLKKPDEKDKEVFPLLEKALRQNPKKLPDTANPADIIEEKWGNLSAEEIARIKPKE